MDKGLNDLNSPHGEKIPIDSYLEKEFFFEYNTAISNTVHKEELLPVLDGFLKEFGIHSLGFLGLLEGNGKKVYDYLFTDSAIVEFDQIRNAVDFLFKETILDRFFEGRKFYRCSSLDLVLSSEPKFLDSAARSLFQTVVAYPLRDSRKRRIGVLALFSLGKKQVSDVRCDIVGNMANLLATALSRHLLREESTRRERDKDALLRLSSDIAINNDRMALLPLLRNVFKKHGFYADIAISLINEDRETTSGYLIDWTKKRHQHIEYRPLSLARHRLDDGVFDKVLGSKSPVLFDLEELTARESVPGYISFLHARGIRHMVVVALHNKGRGIGFLFLFSEKEKKFDGSQLELLYGMSQQVGTAVANIRADENRIKEEYEKSFLLSISFDMARIRKREDLLTVLNNKLRILFDFAHCGIVLIKNGSLELEPFLIDPNSGISHEDDYNDLFKEINANHDNIIFQAINSPEVMIFNLGKENKNGLLPELLLKNFSFGIKEIMSIPLHNENRNFGMLCLLAKRLETFSGELKNLLEGVGNQVSLAVSNILANEELIEREKENMLLLELGNRITICTDKNEFVDLLQEIFDNVMSYQKFDISLITHGERTQTTYLQKIRNIKQVQATLAGSNVEKYAVDDGVYDKVLATDGRIVFFDLEKMQEQSSLPPYMKIYNDCNMALAFPLRINNRCIGAFFIYFNGLSMPDPRRFNLIEGFGAQISLAVSNIMAYEKIAGQLAEIQQYRSKLEVENRFLYEQIKTVNVDSEMIGESPGIKNVQYLVSRVAPSDSTVLITGETGTGKELVARAIHNGSARSNKLMVKVNCAALPANLIESELFGHEKGSFTGAHERRIGKFELANNSTLFLDEIGELSLELQVKLLRVLQENEIERVGGREIIKINVRIVSATNRNIEKEVAEGLFRSDLFYRLNVFPIDLPSLRERRSDIPKLAEHFVHKLSQKLGKKIIGLSDAVMESLFSYAWPGNIRELEHVIERSILMAKGSVIDDVFLAKENIDNGNFVKENIIAESFAANEKSYIIHVLKICGGKINGSGGAAEILGLPATTLHSKIKKLNIPKITGK